MNKKVYLKPQIKCAPLPMESLLASLSNTETGSFTDPDKPQTGPNYGGEGGARELSKKHFDDLSSWDSWE